MFQQQLGHVQAHTGAQRFATVSGLNDMFPENSVQRGLRCVFSCLVGVSEISANQQQHVYKPRGLKETAHTIDPSEVVSAAARYTQQLKILIDMFVVL